MHHEQIFSSSADFEKPGVLKPIKGEASSRKVLLVKDEEPSTELLIGYLEGCGYTIVHTASVEEAVATADVALFDVLLCEIRISDGSGLDVMRMLSHQRQLCGIAFTAFATEENVQQCKSAGFRAVIRKPISLDLVAVTIKKLTSSIANCEDSTVSL